MSKPKFGEKIINFVFNHAAQAPVFRFGTRSASSHFLYDQNLHLLPEAPQDGTAVALDWKTREENLREILRSVVGDRCKNELEVNTEFSTAGNVLEFSISFNWKYPVEEVEQVE